MRASPFLHTEVPLDRGSDAPLAVDLSGDEDSITDGGQRVAKRMPGAWLGMSGYLAAGVLLGLLLIGAMSVAREDSGKAAAGVVTDNVVHLDARAIGESCWRGGGHTGGAPARLTVSLEVGLDGKVRSAVASGESPAMRTCVESHVKAWEFLPQATPSQMVLPFEITAR